MLGYLLAYKFNEKLVDCADITINIMLWLRFHLSF